MYLCGGVQELGCVPPSLSAQEMYVLNKKRHCEQLDGNRVWFSETGLLCWSHVPATVPELVYGGKMGEPPCFPARKLLGHFGSLCWNPHASTGGAAAALGACA